MASKQARLDYYIEQFKKKIDCPNPLFFINNEGLKISAPCGSWLCQACSSWKARRLARNIYNAIKSWPYCRLLTLTVKSDIKIMERLNLFMVKLKQYKKRKIKYVWIKQFQKRGVRHIHMVVDTYISKEWLESNWRGFSDIRLVAGARASRYLTGYLNKEADSQFLYYSGERRYSSSRDLIEPLSKRNGGNRTGEWECVGFWCEGYWEMRFNYFMEANMLYKQDVGYNIRVADHNRILRKNVKKKKYKPETYMIEQQRFET